MANIKIQEFLQRWFDIASVLSQSPDRFAPENLSGQMVRDSRQVQMGDIFVATSGAHFGSDTFVLDALTRGAGLILQSGIAGHEWLQHEQKTVLRLSRPDLADVLPEMAADFYGSPSEFLKLAAVTGTNGKSSVCFLVASALEILGYPCGVIGTLGNGIWPDLDDSPNTTPEPILLHKTLHEWQKRGLVFGVLEASSHALDQGRLRGVKLEIAALTQITSDHLDYHKTFEAYVLAKQKLMDDFGAAIRILNLDDPTGLNWAKKYPDAWGYGQTQTALPLANQCLYQAKETSQGLEIEHLSLGFKSYFSCLGLHNAENLILAHQILVGFDLDATDAWNALQSAKFPSGRLTCLGWDTAKPLVFIDYAHTADALARTLQALKAHRAALGLTNSRIILVFGCGGERDTTKRKPMGQIAGLHSDFCIVTNDNPRSELPESIAESIEEGLQQVDAAWVRCLDRGEAIEMALQQAKAQDYVLIAGKGHEQTQVIGQIELPFSDQKTAKILLDQWQSE